MSMFLWSGFLCAMLRISGACELTMIPANVHAAGAAEQAEDADAAGGEYAPGGSDDGGSHDDEDTLEEEDNLAAADAVGHQVPLVLCTQMLTLLHNPIRPTHLVSLLIILFSGSAPAQSVMPAMAGESVASPLRGHRRAQGSHKV